MAHQPLLFARSSRPEFRAWLGGCRPVPDRVCLRDRPDSKSRISLQDLRSGARGSSLTTAGSLTYLPEYHRKSPKDLATKIKHKMAQNSITITLDSQHELLAFALAGEISP